ncbi:serine protease [Seohaeicola saemankumensis]|nr:serine protease [Seohaeicola saemankumensis]MCA0871034.1 serine protease [Seohaeicola saemankumensis]
MTIVRQHGRLRFFIFAILTLMLAIGLGAGQAAAQDLLEKPAVPRKMADAEIRFVQAALAVDGSYEGPIDGNWSQKSQLAFVQTMRDQFGPGQIKLADLAQLSRRFRTALAGGRWEPVAPDGANLSYVLPLAVVGPLNRQDEIAHADSDGHLIVRTRAYDAEGVLALHNWLLDNALQPDPARRARLSDDMVTTAVLTDRTNTVYIRSLRHGQKYVTVIVQWTPQRAAEARLISGSIQPGVQAPLELPADGLLLKAIAALDGPSDPARPNVPSGSVPVATGFYVNNTDLVTSLAALSDCKALTLADGTRLRRLRIARVHGLALMTSPVRSASWVRLGGNVEAEPGQQVIALGFGTESPANLRPGRSHGRVQGDALIGNNGLRLSVTLPNPPGSGGAPVFLGDGRIAGVLLGRPADEPQAPAHVLPASRLTALLQRSNTLFDRAETQTDVAEGPGPIVPLFCK